MALTNLNNLITCECGYHQPAGNLKKVSSNRFEVACPGCGELMWVDFSDPQQYQVLFKFQGRYGLSVSRYDSKEEFENGFKQFGYEFIDLLEVEDGTEERGGSVTPEAGLENGRNKDSDCGAV